MPHIIILDENRNEIGRVPHKDGERLSVQTDDDTAKIKVIRNKDDDEDDDDE